MKYQSLFSGKNTNKIINLLSAEFSQSRKGKIDLQHEKMYLTTFMHIEDSDQSVPPNSLISICLVLRRL